jgi:hypothetical protein
MARPSMMEHWAKVRRPIAAPLSAYRLDPHKHDTGAETRLQFCYGALIANARTGNVPIAFTATGAAKKRAPC